MIVNPTALFLLLITIFVGGVACGISLMGLLCYRLLSNAYRYLQNPFKDGSKQVDSWLENLKN